uniref:Uncharacterized protein n=1 Tax=Spironucleus salmonicida TaxID=348837 RepID=V6LFB2_9EUKA|eukprot:EST42983.1 Hypothetical protein SS50377_17380 [Spironucleus salmonicida]
MIQHTQRSLSGDTVSFQHLSLFSTSQSVKFQENQYQQVSQLPNQNGFQEVPE